MNTCTLQKQLQKQISKISNSPDINVLHDSSNCNHVARTSCVAEVFRDLHFDSPWDLSCLVLGDLLDADALPVNSDSERVVTQVGKSPRLAALAYSI